MITMMCKPITNSCHDKYFQKQGKCIGHLLGGNQTIAIQVGLQSLSDRKRFANNCDLIYKYRHSVSQSEHNFSLMQLFAIWESADC